jgi:hypothetical protein
MCSWVRVWRDGLAASRALVLKLLLAPDVCNRPRRVTLACRHAQARADARRAGRAAHCAALLQGPAERSSSQQVWARACWRPGKCACLASSLRSHHTAPSPAPHRPPASSVPAQRQQQVDEIFAVSGQQAASACLPCRDAAGMGLLLAQFPHSLTTLTHHSRYTPTWRRSCWPRWWMQRSGCASSAQSRSS